MMAMIGSMVLAKGNEAAGSRKAHSWQIGRPIVTYWAGPAPMTDAAAQQMAEGNWNLVWCRASELDLIHKFGLRGMVYDAALAPQNVDTAEGRAKLDALVKQVSRHPAFYAYFLTDEPSASQFPALGKLVSYLRERDPTHLAYINLFPTYANNEQLGTQGDTITAYREYLRQYMEIVKPDLVSYDHYHFGANGDGNQYFLNLAMIRQVALEAGVPFLNIVQACSWTPSMRIPNGDELRWLVYTTLAYGGQGISFYVYSHPGHNGAMATLDGRPTELYYVAKVLNREFEAIASQLQPLQSLAAYHVGKIPWGAEGLPEKAAFRIVSAEQPSGSPGDFVLGFFGKAQKPNKPATPTHVVVVNLSYKEAKEVTLAGSKRLQLFDPATGKWGPAKRKTAALRLPPGGGALLRVAAP